MSHMARLSGRPLKPVPWIWPPATLTLRGSRLIQQDLISASGSPPFNIAGKPAALAHQEHTQSAMGSELYINVQDT